MGTPSNTGADKTKSLVPHPDSLVGDISPIERFMFSTSEIDRSKTEVELELEAYRTRIDRITQACMLEGHPIIQWILNVSHDRTQLEQLSKGLNKVAELIERLDLLESRLEVLDAAANDPEWFAWAFADTSTMFNPDALLDNES